MMFENWILWSFALALWAMLISLLLSDHVTPEDVENTVFGRMFRRLANGMGRGWDLLLKLLVLAGALLFPRRRPGRGRRSAA